MYSPSPAPAGTCPAASCTSCLFFSSTEPAKRCSSACTSASCGSRPVRVKKAESSGTFGTSLPTVSSAMAVAGSVTVGLPVSLDASSASALAAAPDRSVADVDVIANYTAFQELRRRLAGPGDGPRATRAADPLATGVPPQARARSSRNSAAAARRPGGALRVVVVHPELLGTDGGVGNALVLANRARWRGVEAELVLAPSDVPLPESGDLYCLGGGEDGPQAHAADVEALDEGGTPRRQVLGQGRIGHLVDRQRHRKPIQPSLTRQRLHVAEPDLDPCGKGGGPGIADPAGTPAGFSRQGQHPGIEGDQRAPGFDLRQHSSDGGKHRRLPMDVDALLLQLHEGVQARVRLQQLHERRQGGHRLVADPPAPGGGKLQLCHAAAHPAQAQQTLVVEHHPPPAGGELHVELDVAGALMDRRGEAGQRVLRIPARITAMGDQGGHALSVAEAGARPNSSSCRD